MPIDRSALPPVYFAIRFDVADAPATWPQAFTILSAWETTGQRWTAEQNRAADAKLGRVLQQSCAWFTRCTGVTPETGHAEPGYAVELAFDDACDLGLRFVQDAIYYVDGDVLSVSFCDDRRYKVTVGSFRERVIVG